MFIYCFMKIKTFIEWQNWIFREKIFSLRKFYYYLNIVHNIFFFNMYLMLTCIRTKHLNFLILIFEFTKLRRSSRLVRSGSVISPVRWISIKFFFNDLKTFFKFYRNSTQWPCHFIDSGSCLCNGITSGLR